jgi:hypothetical protein
MAIFGNFKGTTKSEFQIGKNGNRISTGSQPTTDISNGDLFIDNANAQLQIYSNAWIEVGSTLASLNVDNGTLTVDAANDTVSVGSTASNEKLFVNGNLRLGTNPSLQHSGAYLDLRHSNGSTSQVRVRDNGSNTDPIFKIFNADNTSEVFKVQGSSTTINDAYTFPTADGSANQVLVTDGSGNLSFVDNSATGTPGGANTQIQFNDSGDFGGHANLTFDTATETLSTANLFVQNFSYDVLSIDYGSVGETTTVTNDYGDITDEANGDYLNDVVEDTTPQLGGDLDAQNNNINNVGVATAKSYKDTVYTITDSASVDIDPDNGGIQVWTLGANRSPTANNFDTGAKVMLMINDGSSYSITWPSVNWVGGVAPTLPTSGYGIIELWKVGTQLYGAFAGGVA